MEFDLYGQLWADNLAIRFAHNITLTHRRQIGESCVSTGLSAITGDSPEFIRDIINTQSPASWSDYLRPFGWQLAYCNTDLRRLDYYIDELVLLDDLFVICTYSPADPYDIAVEPDSNGWVCGSHFFLLHGETIYDSLYSEPQAAFDYQGLEKYVKRVFRVVPDGYRRAL